MTHKSNFCPDFHQAVELIGRRWSGAIVREMLAGATRFTDLHDAIPARGCGSWNRPGWSSGGPMPRRRCGWSIC
jgi:hypothetical protein